MLNPQKGKIIGIIGPPGSGKTTLEKSMITKEMISKISTLIDSYLKEKEDIQIIRVDVSKIDIRDSNFLRDLLAECNI